ncbi:thioredoxin domain-containing protein [Anaeromyxobacter paludicola]|uniref:Thioredoxin domain-containing protein n=1 Tax=Anaeromyxobacter paludicola TaxID=2918171 RepID=A0ABN6N5G3_9BACT|nr:thioredoxin domain-containing protein [Anaeromyxobacter paludicola]BDG08420.1 thioredoxin domain-containing protein [Anaeromyxobacter paludicola]
MEPLPGAAPFPPELARRLEAALGAMGPSYGPRTHHLEADGRPRYANRLLLESSPYLLQHAHNPVSWRPWGDEAFEEARRSGRPVFLSVGYSTCHWCHVMEAESFEDLEVAEALNRDFVCVKVDREERPDVDAVYMTAVQALHGSGGWPMSVWLTADREPFFGGTYFPARDGDRPGARGFLSILRELGEVWRREPERVRRAQASLTAVVREALEAAPPPAPDLPGPALVERAVSACQRGFDPAHGGLRGAPKFPSSLPVRLLLRHHRRTGAPESLRMATETLRGMATGGIYDQLGGGFHRYATDARWLVPHFEKMLYDNALLAVAYAEGFQATGDPMFARVARETCDYLLRELALSEGGFASATDADSEGEEGRFFVWTARELRERLGGEAERFMAHHGATEAGNFEGANVLFVPRPDEAEHAALSPARARLLEARARRPAPLRDDKVLASWNGLALSALAVCGRILGEPGWLAAASRCAGFLLGALRPEGRLLRSWRAGRAAVPGTLEDHAFLAQGLLDLHEATFDPRWLGASLALCAELGRFADPRGGWFATAADAERLIAREKPSRDGAEPSGASVAAQVLLRLAALTGRAPLRAEAERALRAAAPLLEEHPLTLTEMLVAVELAAAPPREIVLVWPAGEPPPAALLGELARHYLPEAARTGAAEGEPLARLAALAPLVEGRTCVGGRAAAYVCEGGACKLPATDVQGLRAALA